MTRTGGRLLLVSVGMVALMLATRRASAATPFGGDDTGFIPPTKNTLLCENSVAKNVGKAVACILGCHKKRASGVFTDDTSEDQCERTGPAASSCKGKWDVATGNASKINAVCPSCLDATARGNLFGTIETLVDNSINSHVYCLGTTPWGGDDSGNIPPDANSTKCENTVGKAIGKLVACIIKCHQKRAAGKLADDAAEDTCEKSSCQGKYDTVAGNVGSLNAECPSCLNEPTRESLFGTIETTFDLENSMIYCASPSGAFLDGVES